MSFTEFPSRLLENAVNEFASLPGIGRKTAFRLVMNLLRRDAGAKSAETSLILKYAISAAIRSATCRRSV
jgi:recombinational DNA repair protein RecR